MSSLKDKLEAAKVPVYKGPSVQEWLDKLPEKDRTEALEALLDPENFSTYKLFNIFKSEGGRFGREGFTKFRRELLAEHGVATNVDQ